MLFDLDDTLLNRDHAVEKLFLIVLEKCYEDVKLSERNEMLKNSKNMTIEAMAIMIK